MKRYSALSAISAGRNKGDAESRRGLAQLNTVEFKAGKNKLVVQHWMISVKKVKMGSEFLLNQIKDVMSSKVQPP